jgi:hypothetical protein
MKPTGLSRVQVPIGFCTRRMWVRSQFFLPFDQAQPNYFRSFFTNLTDT